MTFHMYTLIEKPDGHELEEVFFYAMKDHDHNDPTTGVRFITESGVVLKGVLYIEDKIPKFISRENLVERVISKLIRHECKWNPTPSKDDISHYTFTPDYTDGPFINTNFTNLCLHFTDAVPYSILFVDSVNLKYSIDITPSHVNRGKIELRLLHSGMTLFIKKGSEFINEGIVYRINFKGQNNPRMAVKLVTSRFGKITPQTFVTIPNTNIDDDKIVEILDEGSRYFKTDDGYIKFSIDDVGQGPWLMYDHTGTLEATSGGLVRTSDALESPPSNEANPTEEHAYTNVFSSDIEAAQDVFRFDTGILPKDTDHDNTVPIPSFEVSEDSDNRTIISEDVLKFSPDEAMEAILNSSKPVIDTDLSMDVPINAGEIPPLCMTDFEMAASYYSSVAMGKKKQDHLMDLLTRYVEEDTVDGLVFLFGKYRRQLLSTKE